VTAHVSDEAFVDAHVHFWDHSMPGLRWAWLEPGFDHPRLKGTHRLDAPRYTTPEFLAESAGTGVVAAVHVQAAAWSERPERETAWLDGFAVATGGRRRWSATSGWRPPTPTRW
jgi:predicted TIM-barrel fold metal-dependent hydrolase